MLPNHYVYKGYRLSANVKRVLAAGATPGLDGVTFRATIVVSRAAEVDEPGIEHQVPTFPQSGGLHSPREAIHLAVVYGCKIVDALPPASPA